MPVSPNTSLRLTPRGLADLAAARKAGGHPSDRATVEAALSLLARLCDPGTAAALGLDGSPARVRQALALAASALEAAARSLPFTEREWCFLADANNGLAILDHEGADGPTAFSVRTHVWANAWDAHRLNRGADRWLVAHADDEVPPDADERAAVDARVEKIVATLRDASDAQAWAVYAALRWFWDNPEADTAGEAWWLPSWRETRSLAAAAKQEG